MAEPFIGEIRIFGFNFAPRGWALCNGQLLPIAQNTALFSLLGTTYGGNGQTTFALPDLRGRASIHFGQGPGLTDREQGGAGGEESVTLTTAQLPAHTHAANCRSTSADAQDPSGKVWATVFEHTPHPHTHIPGVDAYQAGAPNAQMSPSAIGNTGGSQSHDNMPPFLVLNFCIALEGIFPARS